MIQFPIAILEMPEGEDRDYMEWLYTNYHSQMFAVAWKMSKEKAEVEDIVSESVLKLIRHVKKLRTLNEKQLYVYIVKTVKTTAINRKKKQQRYENMEIGDWMFPNDIKSPIEGQIEVEETLQFVLSEIYKLPKKEQQVLRLKYSTEKTDDEIADIVGLSVNSIRKYVSRSRERLKRALYEKGEEQ